MKAIKLGQMVRDTVSGFIGVAVSRHIYMAGCERITVQPRIDKDGKLPDVQTFDLSQLQVYEEKIIKIDKFKKPGGPMPYVPKERR